MKITADQKKSIPFKYAASVKCGELVVGEFIRLAVDRFYRWIDTADLDGYYLDHAAGMRPINFFPTCLNHTIGALAGTPFELAAFQQFTIYNIFAWKDSQGLRRIKTIYDKRAKKNGKTAEMAGLALYVLGADGEEGAEIYVAATKEDQAKICVAQAISFIDSPLANPVLRSVGFYTRINEVKYGKYGGKMRPLGGDSKTQDGVNSHFSIIDEYHGHRDDSVKENLESSSVNRLQPITYHITTAGANVASVCFNYEEVCKDILRGIVAEDPQLWIMIHDLEAADDFTDPQLWIKANPLLGQGLSLKRIEQEYNKCIIQPSKLTNFKTKHLNLWVDSPNTWIDLRDWEKGSAPVRIKNFLLNGCFGAIDLSTTTDLTSLGFLSNADKEGIHDLIVFNFCPKDTIDRRSREDRAPYRYWSSEKMSDYIEIPKLMEDQFKHLLNEAPILVATEGNVVDYNVMADYSRLYYFAFKALGINFDRFNSSQLVTNLVEAGLNLRGYAQTTAAFSTPTKEFERLVLSGKIRHGANPLIAWSLTGCGVYIDPNENIRISKKHSTKRIDPLIASIMALAGVLDPGEENTKKSKYNTEGVDFYV